MVTGRFTEYSQVKTPYTEDWADNRTAQWYAGKKVAYCVSVIILALIEVDQIRIPTLNKKKPDPTCDKKKYIRIRLST